MKSIRILIAALLTAFTLGSSCNTDGPVVTTLKQVKIQPKTASLVSGATQQFTATGTMSDGSSKSVPVTFASDGGAVDANGLFTAGDSAGNYLVTATTPSGNLADTARINIHHVVQRVVLTPDTATVPVGSTLQFSATGKIENGKTVSVAVDYTATGGSIDAAGLYTAGSVAGTFRVIAIQTGGTLADTSTITLTPVLQSVVLTPDTAVLGVGGTQQFSVIGKRSDGSTTPVSVNYSATGGTIDAAGLYTAGVTQGTFRVIATLQGGTFADTSTVVLVPVLQSIILSPDTATIPVGGTKQFSVVGKLSNGTTVPVPVIYTATGGTISGTGLYTAGLTAGTFHVIATQNGGTLSDTSTITLTPVLQHVVLTPDTASIPVGGTTQFSVTGKMSDGSTVPVTVDYSATGGTIDTTGLYTAGASTGTFRVIAVLHGGTLADTSTVVLTPVLQSIVLSPDTATIPVGSTKQFSAVGKLSNGTTVPVTVTYSATGGTIDPAGLYTAGGTAGTFQVIATLSGGSLADTSTVTLTPVLQSIVLTPDTATIPVSTTQQFTVVGKMSDGSTVPVTVTYAATGGTVNGSGLYTAGPTSGTFHVIATLSGGTLADTSVVILTPVLQAIVLSPDTATIPVGTAKQFSAVGKMSDGSTTPVTVNYTATGGTINPAGLYTAGLTAGTFHVIATLSGGSLADTSTITLIPVLQSIVLSPDTVTIPVGTTQPFSVVGKMSDGSTVPVTVTYTATGGTISTGGLYTAGLTSGTFHVIATVAGGLLADTSTITLTPVLQSIVLSPDSVSLATAATKQFSVIGKMSDGSTVPVTVNYSATGGTISGSGLYTAGGSAGTFRVIAVLSGGTFADTSKVIITSGGTGHVYSTLFPLTENPISEGGNWVNGGTTGLDWTDVSTTPGLAIGHQVGASFTDATALLTGTWGADQLAQAVVHSLNQSDGCFEEVELRLRSAISANNNRGYEVAFHATTSGAAYVIIVRWNGNLGDFNTLADSNGVQYAVTEGDTVRATIIGNTIKAYRNGVLLAQASDATWTTGAPGMGFNLENGNAGCPGRNGDYGYTSYMAADTLP